MRPSTLLALALVIGTSATARAFCGFYVKEDDTRITSRASRVILLRDGSTTVLSMQNTYEGPPEDFALIVPVPTAIGPEDVRTLEPEVFDRVDQLSSPRLVEYQQQPGVCPSDARSRVLYGMGYGGGSSAVSIVAQFAVGEYDVQILDASESSGLEAWLRAEGYHIPDGASEALRPYVQQGYRFFAARVSSERVSFEDGRALLSPLRIHYASDQLVLPIRLGRLSADGEQDLIVYVLSREGRYEVANRQNVFVPTNLEVSARVRGRFGAVYDALLDRIWERHPDAVVTEYAWDATRCDPCPGPTVSAEDITTLGGDHVSGATEQVQGGVGFRDGPHAWLSGPPMGRPEMHHLAQTRLRAMTRCVRSPLELHAEVDVVDGAVVRAQVDVDGSTGRCLERALVGDAPPQTAGRPTRLRLSVGIDRTVRRVLSSAQGFTLTRLRYRSGPGSPESDLVFRRAAPIEGGNGVPDRRGHLRTEPHEAEINRFQARYTILHRTPPRRCEGGERPIDRGWGAPDDDGTSTARALEAIERDRPIRLRRLIRTGVPDLGLRPRRRRRRAGRERWGMFLLPTFLLGGALLSRRRRRG